MSSSPTSEDQLSIPGRYSASGGACPGALTPPSMCIHLKAASKGCRCVLHLRQSRVGHWMDPKQPSSLLTIPATNCIQLHEHVKSPPPPLHTHPNSTSTTNTTSPLHIWHFCVQATLISGKQRSIERPCLYSQHITDVFALQLKQGQSCTLTRALKRRLCLKYPTRLQTAMQTKCIPPTKGYAVTRAGLKIYTEFRCDTDYTICASEFFKTNVMWATCSCI